MNKSTFILILLLPFFVASVARSQSADSTEGYIIRHESSLLKSSTSPHQGQGSVQGCAFFDDLKDFNISFRKRVLPPGASLGKHLQKHDEIYYVVSGAGTIRINDVPFKVAAGDAILTREGNSHELIQSGADNLVILVIFDKPR